MNRDSMIVEVFIDDGKTSYGYDNLKLQKENEIFIKKNKLIFGPSKAITKQ